MCGFFPILSSAPQAFAVGTTPTIAITSVTGAVPYTGTANLLSGLPKLATQIGKTITFNVTLSNLTPGQAPTGQVRIHGDDDTKAFYCTTSTFNFSGTEATASCAWKVRSPDAQKFFAKYLTDPTKYKDSNDPATSTDYLNATSAAGREIFVAGIVSVYGLSDSLAIGSSTTITAETHQDFYGKITFNLNGSPIDGCENRTSGSANITCAFEVPAGASTLTFTFDYTPATSYVTAGLSTQFASFPMFHTVGSYYHPNSTSWSAETAYNANYNESTLDSTFYEKDGLYYKLNAANGQAMVMAYKRSVLTNTVNIPATFTATGFSSSNTALNRTNPIFNRTYTVTQIGKSAFQLDSSNIPATLISSLTIPNTVTAIKERAFYRQCNIASIVIPDSVRVIGVDSFSNMEAGNTLDDCVGKSGVVSLVVGAGIESLGDNSLKGTTPSLLQFNGSPESMFFNLKPSNFDAFQFNDAYGRVGDLGLQVNSCSKVISYSGIVTGNFVGSQLKAWQHWATANNCIPNTNLKPAEIFLKPSPIAQPTVDSATVTSLRVTWTAPISDGDSTITGYSLQYSSNSGSTWTQSSCSSCQLSASPYVVTGLDSATVYIFRVNATNGIGTSDWSTPSSPNSTLAFTLPPDFTISPISETATVGVAITGYVLTSVQPSASFAISPSIPAGLSFSTSTGLLSGTPTTVTTSTVYTITGTNTQGTDTATFTLAVIEQAPDFTISPTTLTATVGTAITGYVLTSTYSSNSFAVSPAVPAGLTFSTVTGLLSGTPTVVSTATVYTITGTNTSGTDTATFTLIVNAAPVATPTPTPTPTPTAVVTGPPPSSLKTLTQPKISRDATHYICTTGTFLFIRNGYTEEAPKLTSQTYFLVQNGKIVETIESDKTIAKFEKKSQYLNTTLSCVVQVGQENLISTVTSLDSKKITSANDAKRTELQNVDAKYYADRAAAYAKKDKEFARIVQIKGAEIAAAKTSSAILTASTKYRKSFAAASELWKLELSQASINRALAKETAQANYLDTLEKAGMSVYPQEAKAVVTPTPTPTVTPKPTPSPTQTSNPQPTAQMEKVGTVYMASGSYFLNDATKLTLKALALKINASGAKSILVYGHTDIRGGVNNTVLSQNRAKAVANFLRPLLTSKKISIGWYASKKPAAGGTSAAALALNRRVEIYTK